MFLSRLMLNPRSRQVQRELADLYQMHRTIFSAFPEHLPEWERVLFRLEIDIRLGIPKLLVQSQTAPNWSGLQAPEKDYLLPFDEENPATKEIHLALQANQLLFFRLRANPTIKVSKENKDNGQRKGLLRQEDQLKWLVRKMTGAGAQVVEANTGRVEKVFGTAVKEGRPHKIELVAVQFDGLLKVQDPAQLLQAVTAGIGSAKGFGFGLLSLAPAHQ